MKKNRKTSGIQRRYLKYTAALLGLALLLSSVGVIISVRNRLTRSIIDKYEFMTERMGLTLENMYRKSDETTAECILYDDVQQSLKNQGLEEVRYIALSKYFAYIDLVMWLPTVMWIIREMYTADPIQMCPIKI